MYVIEPSYVVLRLVRILGSTSSGANIHSGEEFIFHVRTWDIGVL